jgi:glycosyltransferase involved in cell wall biosynthesis
VCHIAYTFFDADNRVMRYVQALSSRGDQVDVIALRQPDQAWREAGADGVRHFRIQRRSPTEKGPLAYLLKLLWFCLKSSLLATALHVRRRYDVVHVHNIPDFLVFSAWLPKLLGASVILDIHDVVPELYAGKFGAGGESRTFKALVAVERLCCRSADHVIIANDLWRTKLVARSVADGRCTTFLNYPDLDIFRPAAAEEKSAARGFRILYPGSLNYHQGLDLAIRAFAKVHAQMPDADFHIYGRGPTLPDLIRLSKELGLEDRVRFMEGVSLLQIAPIMASASVGVVPKRNEGFGSEAFSTKIFEFMACGVPVIVSRTRIDAHYFNDALVNFFEPGNADDLADVLLRTYQDRAGQAARVQAARAFAEHYSWQNRSGNYCALIDSLALPSSGHDTTALRDAL